MLFAHVITEYLYAVPVYDILLALFFCPAVRLGFSSCCLVPAGPRQPHFVLRHMLLHAWYSPVRLLYWSTVAADYPTSETAVMGGGLFLPFRATPLA